MAINKDLSDMPFAGGDRGFPPTTSPVVLDRAFDVWYRKWQERQAYAPAIPELRFRASSVGKRCDRALQYEIMGVEGEEIGLQTAWRFAAGHYAHDHLGDALLELDEGWRREVRVDLRAIGIDGSAHADYVRMVCNEHGLPMREYGRVPAMREGQAVTYACQPAGGCNTGPLYEGERGADWNPDVEHGDIVIEAKSKGGFQFKKAAIQFKGVPQGPAHGDIMQGALAARPLGCEKLIVIYIALENVSNGLAESLGLGPWAQFSAEWKYGPAINPLVDAEIARINRLMAAVDAGVLVPRQLSDIQEYPEGAVITEPRVKDAPWRLVIDGQVKASGKTWQCGYCSFFDRCVQDGPGTAATEDVV